MEHSNVCSGHFEVSVRQQDSRWIVFWSKFLFTPTMIGFWFISFLGWAVPRVTYCGFTFGVYWVASWNFCCA